MRCSFIYLIVNKKVFEKNTLAMENNMEVPQKITKRVKHLFVKIYVCSPMFTAALFIVVKT